MRKLFHKNNVKSIVAGKNMKIFNDKIKSGLIMFKGGHNKPRYNCSFKATMEDICMAENLVYLGKTEVEIRSSSNEKLYIRTLKMNGKFYIISIGRFSSIVNIKKQRCYQPFTGKLKQNCVGPQNVIGKFLDKADVGYD